MFAVGGELEPLAAGQRRATKPAAWPVKAAAAVAVVCILCLAHSARPSRRDPVELLQAPQCGAYPRSYLSLPAGKLVLDGRLDEPGWQQAAWTEDFVDIRGAGWKDQPPLRTRAKLLWDKDYLYVGAEIQEPDVWANITKDNVVMYQDNDFEVFIDADGSTHGYKELEVNARCKAWSLQLNKPYLNGGAEDSRRVKADGFDLGATCAATVDGTLNDPSDTDRGWQVELAIPVAKVGSIGPGKFWRINFSRVQWHTEKRGKAYHKVPKLPEENWVWGATGVVNIHLPERWPIVQFGGAGAQLAQDPSWPARDAVTQVYDAQQEFKKQHGRYAPDVSALGLAPCVPVQVQSTPAGDDFTATASSGVQVTIQADRLITIG